MSLCINPRCSQPANPDHNKFCNSCGSELLLRGRYRVVNLLSDKGGFAHTYEVIDQDTPKVLKVLTNNQEKAIELFQQEAKVLSQLKHPGIPKGEGSFVYFPRDSKTGLHCLVMEKVEGQDLEEYQKENRFKPIEQELALEWLSQLAAILHEVHRRQFFHRDIKPSNIILRPDGQLTLIDFGAARHVTRTIMAGGQSTGIYTPGYAPPEQEKGHAVPQSDFYALGRTFVYLLTGKEPNDPTIYDFQNNELKWRKFAPNITPELGDFIDQLIDDKPAYRPANTEVILQKLAQLKQDILNPPPPPSPKTVSQQTTVTQPPPQQQIQQTPQATPIIQGHYAGFWLRFKAATFDNFMVMILAASLASLITYQLYNSVYSGWLYEWLDYIGFWDYSSRQELMIFTAIISALGTTILGLVFTLFGLATWLTTPEYIINLLPPEWQFPVIEELLNLVEGNLELLIPLIFGAFIKWFYFTFSEGILQATLGKMLFGLRIETIAEKPMNLTTATRRYWSKLLSFLPLFTGFMLAAWTPRKRALHDFLAGTVVVRK